MSKNPTVSLATDIVVLAPKDDTLQVLLIQRKYPPFKGLWALPGGYVDDGETSRQAAHRELEEETGVLVVPLRRIDVYDTPDRDPRGRVVSVAYSALLPSAPETIAGDDAAAAEWVRVDELLKDRQALAFDHVNILADAIEQAGLSSICAPTSANTSTR